MHISTCRNSSKTMTLRINYFRNVCYKHTGLSKLNQNDWFIKFNVFPHYIRQCWSWTFSWGRSRHLSIRSKSKCIFHLFQILKIYRKCCIPPGWGEGVAGAEVAAPEIVVCMFGPAVVAGDGAALVAPDVGEGVTEPSNSQKTCSCQLQ